jgi:hypothetical protein
MLFYNGKQVLEGIDSIDLLIRPYLYNFLYLKKQIDPNQKISIYTTCALIPQDPYYSIKKYYHYLHISGEFINPELPIKETIAMAISTLVRKRVLCIESYLDKNKKIDEISIPLIMQNLEKIVTGISGIEFCFDFEEKMVKISEHAKIISGSDISLKQFLNKKIKKRDNCLIQEDTTYYSYDYKGKRKSTLKLYNRARHLKNKNNEYSFGFIEKNLYIMRIEFVLKRNRNTNYLTFNNMNGNYSNIIESFIPYLAKLYKKYFLNNVLVNPINHPYFIKIYSLANCESIMKNKSLGNSKQERELLNKNSDDHKFYQLIDSITKESKKMDKIKNNPPNSYFYWPEDKTTRFSIIPTDYEDEDKILLRIDDQFTFFKHMMVMPKFKDINENEENNEKS